jgi:hypothetical protein
MAGGDGKERPRVLTIEDKEAWGAYNRILISIEEILTRPQAAKNIRKFMKGKLPMMLDEVIKGDGRIEK